MVVHEGSTDCTLNVPQSDQDDFPHGFVIAKKAGICKSRQDRWHDIWFRKGQNSAGLALHHVNGFLQLSDQQYREVVRTLSDPIDIKPQDAVLDCGCGSGAFLREISSLYGCTDLSGIDYSKTLIDVASNSLAAANLHVGNVCDLSPFAGESFHVVTCFSVYFYLSSVADAEKALREAIRVCRKGGSVFVGDVSDLAKEELALELRNESHRDQPKMCQDSPDHLYLPKSMFLKVGAELGMENIRIIDHDQVDLLQYYDTAAYRFSVYMTKSAAGTRASLAAESTTESSNSDLIAM